MMDQPVQSKHTGRKIWYGAVIALSALLLVICVVGLIGTWVLQSKLSDFTVSLLQTAENAAGKAQELMAQAEQPLGEIQQIAAQIADASTQLSQNVEDEGLLKLLLTPEQEQKLTDLATKVQGTLATIQEVLSNASSLYQAIDKIPFINLPTPGLEKVREVEQAVADIRLGIEELKGRVAEIRAGAVEKIGMVTDIATRVSDRLIEVLDKMAVLDGQLESLQATLSAIREAIPSTFAILALLLSLFYVYVGYTQVEVIRLFLGRWRMLRAPVAELPAESVVEVQPDETPLVEDEPGETEPDVGEQG